MQAADVRVPISDRRQHLRLFFSAALFDGAAFKNRSPAEQPGGSARAWPTVFEQFFNGFIAAFRDELKVAREDETDDAWLAPLPQLWKINGDAVLFTELVYPDPAQRHVALGTSLRTFVDVVQRLDAVYMEKDMGVRGCVWTAGFPLRNKPIRVVEGNIEIIDADPGRFDPETGDTQPAAMTVTDYIGRDMDLGFQLAAIAPAKRVVCSFDIAQFVTDLPNQVTLTAHHVGWQPLPGILRDRPYPIVWLETARPALPRHSWETRDARISDYARKLLYDDTGLTKRGFEALATRLDDEFPGHMIRAYASALDMPAAHYQPWTANEPIHPAGPITPVNSTDAIAANATARPDEVAPITLDDLNQILLFLQEHPERAREVRAVLTAVAGHASYADWHDRYEFRDLMYRLDNVLAFENDSQRRLLEMLRLVQADVLRVKLHLRDGHVFMTDGLWISSSIRVFPFVDESDLVLRACGAKNWTNWATCVIDPATGCGHNLLRYPSKDVRRYGFDRSARAVTYAAINVAINEFEDTLVGVNDITRGLPLVFGDTEPERVLVLANMPFALVPKPDTISKSTDGGPRGYRLTLDLFDAVDQLAASLSPGSELRCVVLVYTLGMIESDRWVVPERAAKLFGADRVTWSVVDDEKLWRVNGKKEQSNPMSLDRMSLKADCRFYVRDDARRGAVRADYVQLETELRDEGYDHLAYGTLTIERPVARADA